MPLRRRVRGPLGGAPVIRAAARPVVRVGAAGMGRFLGRLAGRGLAAAGGPLGIAASVGAAVADAVHQYAADGGGPIGAVRDFVAPAPRQRLIPDYFPRNNDFIDVVDDRDVAMANGDPIADAQPYNTRDRSDAFEPRRKRRRFSDALKVLDNYQAKYVYDPTLPSWGYKRTRKGRYYSRKLARSGFLSGKYF